MAKTFDRSFALLAVLALTGCPSPNQGTQGSLPRAYPAAEESALSSPGSGAAKAAAPRPGATTAPMAPPTEAAADAAVGEAAAEPQTQTVIKAGAVDDNAKFQAYLQYLDGYQGPAMRQYDVTQRHVLQVVGSDDKSVANADVTVAVGEQVLFSGKSYANGQLLFHPKAFPAAVQATSFSVTATKGDQTVTQTFEPGAEGVWELKLPAAIAKSAAKLDVLFLIDASGSMGGEIRRLQSTLQTISDRVKGLESQPQVRFALVSYRDQGDEYVTRKTDFTADLPSFQTALNGVEAAGGGDIPEDLESGLKEAVSGVSWDGGDAVRLVFLVADAAPHIDYPQSVPYTTSMQNAAKAGIKLYTVGASGLTKEGEYCMRQLAQATMAQYLFITRGGDSDAGGGEVSHTVDKFTEGRLDDIVVDIVKAELDSLGK